MKKTLWMLGVAVTALTSCTESEVVDIPESRVIGFDTFVEKPTRADVTDAINADFKEFYVYGAKGTKTSSVYSQDGALVLGENGGQLVKGGKGNWSYEPHAVWLENHIYRFAAYANGNGDGTTNAAKLTTGVAFVPGETDADAKWGLNISNYTVSDKDLVVAAPNEIDVTNLNAAPPQVSLDFKHVLSKVIFQFYYTGNSNAGSKLEIAPFSLVASKTGDLVARFESENPTAGTIALTATWDIVQVPGNYGELSDVEQQKYKYDFFPKEDSKNQSWSSGSIQSAVYMLPQPNQNLFIPEITIYTKDSNEDVTNTMTYTNVSLYMDSYPNWRPGFVYRYVADISPTAHQIHFTTKVTTFGDDQNRNQTITSGGVVTP